MVFTNTICTFGSVYSGPWKSRVASDGTRSELARAFTALVFTEAVEALALAVVGWEVDPRIGRRAPRPARTRAAAARQPPVRTAARVLLIVNRHVADPRSHVPHLGAPLLPG